MTKRVICMVCVYAFLGHAHLRQAGYLDGCLLLCVCVCIVCVYLVYILTFMRLLAICIVSLCTDLELYISNCLGVSQVLIVFGAASAIMSGLIGRLIKYVPHFALIWASMSSITLFLTRPLP